jgi:UDP-glucose/GDP-mannose dehydrogenase family, NAD binding domain
MTTSAAAFVGSGEKLLSHLTEFFELLHRRNFGRHDFDPQTVAKLRQGEPPIFEPGLKNLIREGVNSGKRFELRRTGCRYTTLSAALAKEDAARFEKSD